MKLLVFFTLFAVPLACNASFIPNVRARDDQPSSTHASAPGALKANARFGPFTLPSMHVNGALGESGMIMESIQDIPMPCSDCTFTYLRGDMVYENGTTANTENGAYMHHVTLTTQPKNSKKIDGGAPAGQAIAVPSGLRNASKPIYLSGNERLAIAYPNAGVYYPRNSSVVLNVDLQNQTPEPKEVWVSMEYEYLLGKPEGYLDIIPVGQNALGEGGQKQEGVWEATSAPYQSQYDARILMMYGHLHDGGIHTEIKINDKVVCDSIAVYLDMEGAVAGTSGHSHGGESKRDGPNAHLQSATECKEVGEIKKGDTITTKVFYDFNKRQANIMANGNADPLMGISMTYLGIPFPTD